MIPKRNKQPSQAAPDNFALQNYEFNFKQATPDEFISIRINGKNVASLGGLVVLTGKPKARKSTFLHSIIASSINYNTIYDITATLPPDKKNVVLVDTEQSNYDLFKSMERLAYNLNTDIKNLSSLNFILYAARLLDSDDIIKLIDTILLNNKNIGLLCIDSLLDLCEDINDVSAAKKVIQKIKYWLDTYNITIISVIHQSKSTNFSLGHLGSFASRFCQSEIQVTKNEDLTSTLSAVYMRSDENFNPVSIEYNENTKNYQQVTNGKTYNLEEINHRDIINKVFAANNNHTYKSLKEALRGYYSDKSGYWVENNLIPFLYEKRFITKHKNNIILVR